jgi:hypothetical protein
MIRGQALTYAKCLQALIQVQRKRWAGEGENRGMSSANESPDLFMHSLHHAGSSSCVGGAVGPASRDPDPPPATLALAPAPLGCAGAEHRTSVGGDPGRICGVCPTEAGSWGPMRLKAVSRHRLQDDDRCPGCRGGPPEETQVLRPHPGSGGPSCAAGA